MTEEMVRTRGLKNWRRISMQKISKSEVKFRYPFANGIAETPSGEVASAEIVIWDNKRAYRWSAASHTNFKDTGAISGKYPEGANMSQCIPQLSLQGSDEKYKIKILFISAVPITDFLKSDLELLKRHFNVKVIKWGSLKNPKFLLKMIKGVLWADLTFSWFAGTHAFLAVRLSKIFRKKAIVVVGGYEVAKVPEIGYGAMLNPRSARKVKYVLENANKVLAVSEFNKKEILKYTNPKNVELVYNGVDYDKFKPKGEKGDLVTTVGYITNAVIKRKGFDAFVEAAKYLPEIKFMLIGKHVDNSIEYLKSMTSSNVEFTGFVSDGELMEWYQKAKVYCQLSLYESFGMALAESMCCECAPVVINNAALPEVVGDTGLYVPYNDPKATAEAIKKALKSNKGKEARERIKNMFPIEKREERLVEIIRGLIKEGK